MTRPALALALSSLLAAGCGGDDRPGRTVTVQAGAKLTVAGNEYSFDPSTIVVDGAGTLTLTLRNDGSLAHNLKLFRGGADEGGTPTFPGGRSESARVRLSAGDYEMVCTVGDHEELGMVGTLRVR